MQFEKANGRKKIDQGYVVRLINNVILSQVYIKQVGDLKVFLTYVRVGKGKTQEKTFLSAEEIVAWLTN